MFDFVSFIPRAIVQGIPLLFGSTGETLTEKSGNLNLGIPGIMYVGGICGEQVDGEPAGALRADSRQAPELVDQVLDRAFVHECQPRSRGGIRPAAMDAACGASGRWRIRSTAASSGAISRLAKATIRPSSRTTARGVRSR